MIKLSKGRNKFFGDNYEKKKAYNFAKSNYKDSPYDFHLKKKCGKR